MRPLNRPMFRYGGPIKEGVMSGIREPHAGGGRIGFKDGPKKKKYKLEEAPIGKFGNWLGDKAVPGGVYYGLGTPIQTAFDIGAIPINTLSRLFGYNPGYSGTKFVDTLSGGSFSKFTGFDRDKALGTSAKQGWTTPSMQEGPTAAEIELAKLKKQIADQKKGTMPENLGLKPYTKSAEETRAEKLQRYRDIVDIKGMNREAAGKSLIEASRLINESQDFKGDIRSGKLINRIIQGASKAYDKPADMRRAIDTLILKGEIQKDLSAETDALDKEYKRAKIAESKKALKGNTPAQNIAALSAKATGGKPNSVTVAAGYKSSGIVPNATITDTIVDEWIDDKAGRTEIDYVKEVISKADGFGPGLYVVGDRAVIFDGTTYEYDY